MSTVYDEKLLDKVGMAMVPSGYTNNVADEVNAGGALGKVYSVLPVETTGDNLVTNGTFDTDLSWDIFGESEIQNGSARIYSSGGALSYIGQNSILVNNQKYKLTYEVKQNVQGSLKLTNVNGQADFPIPSTEGLHSLYFTASNPNFFILRNVGATDIKVDNVSVRSVSNGDFDFSRGSDATRVNSQGYIESVQVLSDELVQNGDFEEIGSELVQNGDFEQIGSELVTNGTFDADSDWNKINSTISGGKGNLDGTSVTSMLYQGVLTNGLFYKATFTISDYNLIGDADIINDSGGKYYIISSEGTFTIYFKHTDANNNLYFRARNGAIFSIDNVSVKEVGQNWTFGTGWSYEDGKASRTAQVSSSQIDASNTTLTIGSIYKCVMTVSNVSGGAVRFQTGNVGSTLYTSDGTYTEYIKAQGTSFSVKGNSDFIGSIDNVSIKEVGQNWTFTNATINNGEVVLSPSATISQSFGLINGKKYRINYDITSISAGSSGITAYAGSTGAGTTRTEIGTYTEDIVASGALSLYFFTGGGFVSGTIDNVSVKEVTDDTDIPRLDYTNQACPSLLLEPQRSNEVLYSEAFSEWDSSILSPVVTSNFATSPEGSQNATKLTFTQPLDAVSDIVGVFSLGTTLTFSMYVKNIDSSVTQVLIRNSSTDFASSINWSGLQISSVTTTLGTLEYEEIGNDWYRIYGTYTVSNDTVQRIRLRGDGTNDSYLVYGAQLEQGSYPTSYIPTNGLLVTRRADLCNNAGDSTIFNDSEGVLFAEANPYFPEGNRQISISDGSISNRIVIEFRNNGTELRGYIVQGGSVEAQLVGATPTLNQNYKIAIRYKNNDASLWVNGVQVDTDASLTTPINLNQLALDGGNAVLPFYGNVRQLLYFNEALSDAELEYITSADIDLTIHNYKGSLSKISATYEDVGVKDRLTKLF